MRRRGEPLTVVADNALRFRGYRWNSGGNGNRGVRRRCGWCKSGGGATGSGMRWGGQEEKVSSEEGYGGKVEGGGMRRMV